eukprot:SAG31_NODE_15041_length_773_cov_1.781899_2_plen_55_part_01
MDAITYARGGFLASTVVAMEANAPDVVALMLKHCEAMQIEITPDGQQAISAGKVR